MKKNKIKKQLKLHNKSKSKKSVDDLYLKYIDTLVKSENLQNKLEKMCTSFIDSPNDSAQKKANYINNNLNNMLVEVMLMQNLINYIETK